MSLSITKRRIQRLGGSSLIVTIPKSWARKIGLRVGDEVVVVDEGDHLKVLPPSSKLVKTLGSAQVRLAGYVKNIDPSHMAYCAYTRGFDKLIVELPKSNGITPEKVARELEKSRYVESATPDYSSGIVEAYLNSRVEDGGPRTLKTVGSIIVALLERAAGGKLTEDDLGTELARVEDILDGLVRAAYKHKVLTCSGENVDPLVLGEMRAAASIIRELLLQMAGDPESARIAEVISKIVMALTGGIANQSGKRLLETLNMIPEAIQAIEQTNADTRTKTLAVSLLRVAERIARDSLCPSILTEIEE